jgi:hypothetical protein
VRQALRIPLALAWLVATAGAARAQPDDSLHARLRTLAAAAELLDSKLPTFACHETFTSQLLQGRKMKRQVTGAGELRVQPDENGKLDEDFQTTEINSRPAQGFPRVPMFVEGGFQNAIQLFRPSDQRCFLFNSDGDRIEFQSRPDAPEDSCGRRTGVSGFALFDSSGTLTHIESHTEEEAASRRRVVPYAALDLSPIQLGGTTFLLSTHVLAERYLGKTTLRWEASYTNCRLYQVTVKIGPATSVPEDSPK